MIKDRLWLIVTYLISLAILAEGIFETLTSMSLIFNQHNVVLSAGYYNGVILIFCSIGLFMKKEEVRSAIILLFGVYTASNIVIFLISLIKTDWRSSIIYFVYALVCFAVIQFFHFEI